MTASSILYDELCKTPPEIMPQSDDLDAALVKIGGNTTDDELAPTSPDETDVVQLNEEQLAQLVSKCPKYAEVDAHKARSALSNVRGTMNIGEKRTNAVNALRARLVQLKRQQQGAQFLFKSVHQQQHQPATQPLNPPGRQQQQPAAARLPTAASYFHSGQRPQQTAQPRCNSARLAVAMMTQQPGAAKKQQQLAIGLGKLDNVTSLSAAPTSGGRKPGPKPSIAPSHSVAVVPAAAAENYVHPEAQQAQHSSRFFVTPLAGRQQPRRSTLPVQNLSVAEYATRGVSAGVASSRQQRRCHLCNCVLGAAGPYGVLHQDQNGNPVCAECQAEQRAEKKRPQPAPLRQELLPERQPVQRQPVQQQAVQQQAVQQQAVQQQAVQQQAVQRQAAGAASVAAARGRQGSKRHGDKETPITLLDSDDEQDSADKQQQGGAADHAVLSSGDEAPSKRRRSERLVSFIDPAPSTAAKFKGLHALYPNSGGKGAVSVTPDDLARLDTGEFLNDTIIDYYIKVIEESLTAEERSRYHFFNSFFYKKLTEETPGTSRRLLAADKAKQNHDRVKTWTKGVNIFEKDYLFVPIHDALHWSLVIVCHPNMVQQLVQEAEINVRKVSVPASKAAGLAAQRRLEEQQQQQSSQDAASAAAASRDLDGAGGVGPRCCLVHLDSMEGGHSTHTVGAALRSYLCQEWQRKQAELMQHQAPTAGGPQEPDDQQQQQQAEEEQQHQKFAAQVLQNAFGPTVLSQKRVETLPKQDNHCDCGLFVLTYLEYFIHARPAAVRVSSKGKRHTVAMVDSHEPRLLTKEWFDPELASCLRAHLRTQLLELMVDQAADKASDAVAAAVAEIQEYREQLRVKETAVKAQPDGEVNPLYGYVLPKDYAALHQQLEAYKQHQRELQKQAKAAKLAQRKSRAEQRRDQVRLQQAAAAAGAGGSQGAGFDVDFGGLTDLLPPPNSNDPDWAPNSDKAAADQPQRLQRRTHTQDSDDEGSQQQQQQQGQPAGGRCRPAGKFSAADADSDDAEDDFQKPRNKRGAGAAAQRQTKQHKTQQQQPPQQGQQQQQLHPEQEEDAVYGPEELLQQEQILQQCKEQQQRQQRQQQSRRHPGLVDDAGGSADEEFVDATSDSAELMDIEPLGAGDTMEQPQDMDVESRPGAVSAAAGLTQVPAATMPAAAAAAAAASNALQPSKQSPPDASTAAADGAAAAVHGEDTVDLCSDDENEHQQQQQQQAGAGPSGSDLGLSSAAGGEGQPAAARQQKAKRHTPEELKRQAWQMMTATMQAAEAETVHALLLKEFERHYGDNLASAVAAGVVSPADESEMMDVIFQNQRKPRKQLLPYLLDAIAELAAQAGQDSKQQIAHKDWWTAWQLQEPKPAGQRPSSSRPRRGAAAGSSSTSRRGAPSSAAELHKGQQTLSGLFAGGLELTTAAGHPQAAQPDQVAAHLLARVQEEGQEQQQQQEEDRQQQQHRATGEEVAAAAAAPLASSSQEAPGLELVLSQEDQLHLPVGQLAEHDSVEICDSDEDSEQQQQQQQGTLSQQQQQVAGHNVPVAAPNPWQSMNAAQQQALAKAHRDAVKAQVAGLLNGKVPAAAEEELLLVPAGGRQQQQHKHQQAGVQLQPPSASKEQAQPRNPMAVGGFLRELGAQVTSVARGVKHLVSPTKQAASTVAAAAGQQQQPGDPNVLTSQGLLPDYSEGSLGTDPPQEQAAAEVTSPKQGHTTGTGTAAAKPGSPGQCPTAAAAAALKRFHKKPHQKQSARIGPQPAGPAAAPAIMQQPQLCATAGVGGGRHSRAAAHAATLGERQTMPGMHAPDQIVVSD